MIYRCTITVLRFLLRRFFTVSVIGRENVPSRGAFIFAPNHVSHLDPIMVGVHTRADVYYLAKRELYTPAAFGWYLRKLNTIPIDRERMRISSIRQISKIMRNGHGLLIFPEGTRSDGNAFLEPEAGVAHFALKFDVPVVPAYVGGTARAFPRGARHLNRGCHIWVRYGTPRYYKKEKGISKKDLYRRISNDIMQELHRLKCMPVS